MIMTDKYNIKEIQYKTYSLR